MTFFTWLVTCLAYCESLLRFILTLFITIVVFLVIMVLLKYLEIFNITEWYHNRKLRRKNKNKNTHSSCIEDNSTSDPPSIQN